MNQNLILSNGVGMPCIGMGTYPLQGRAMLKAVVAATQFGYRAFDTAHAYGNEASLGQSLREAYKQNGLKREDVFITSKIGEKLENGIPDGNLFYASYPNEKRDIKRIVTNQLYEILKNLQTDYLDLLLIHWPHPDFLVEIWEAIIDQYHAGKVRAIGVSNCRERHIKRLIDAGTLCPMVNQFERHPLNNQKGLIKYCQESGIQVEAFSPLLMMNNKLMKSPVLESLSHKYTKTIPQIILRWNIQQGVIPIPKSGNPVRLLENFSIFDFDMTSADLEAIDALNENYKMLVESRYCPGY